jgi:hypothetical protein
VHARVHDVRAWWVHFTVLNFRWTIFLLICFDWLKSATDFVIVFVLLPRRKGMDFYRARPVLAVTNTNKQPELGSGCGRRCVWCVEDAVSHTHLTFPQSTCHWRRRWHCRSSVTVPVDWKLPAFRVSGAWDGFRDTGLSVSGWNWK